MEVVGDVEDWRQALELARPLKPDVVLTDTSMPETVGVAGLLTKDDPLDNLVAAIRTCVAGFKHC